MRMQELLGPVRFVWKEDKQLVTYQYNKMTTPAWQVIWCLCHIQGGGLACCGDSLLHRNVRVPGADAASSVLKQPRMPDMELNEGELEAVRFHCF